MKQIILKLEPYVESYLDMEQYIGKTYHCYSPFRKEPYYVYVDCMFSRVGDTSTSLDVLYARIINYVHVKLHPVHSCNNILLITRADLESGEYRLELYE